MKNLLVFVLMTFCLSLVPNLCAQKTEQAVEILTKKGVEVTKLALQGKDFVLDPNGRYWVLYVPGSQLADEEVRLLYKLAPVSGLTVDCDNAPGEKLLTWIASNNRARSVGLKGKGFNDNSLKGPPMPIKGGIHAYKRGRRPFFG